MRMNVFVSPPLRTTHALGHWEWGFAPLSFFPGETSGTGGPYRPLASHQPAIEDVTALVMVMAAWTVTVLAMLHWHLLFPESMRSGLKWVSGTFGGCTNARWQRECPSLDQRTFWSCGFDQRFACVQKWIYIYIYYICVGWSVRIRFQVRVICRQINYALVRWLQTTDTAIFLHKWARLKKFWGDFVQFYFLILQFRLIFAGQGFFRTQFS